MAKVGAKRAADLTGKSKSTIQRAMKSGKISYELDKNNRRVIDVSELDRVFGLSQQKEEKTNTITSDGAKAELERATQMLEIERLKMQVKFLEEQLEAKTEQLEDLKGQRDQWQKQAQQVLITSEYSQKQAEGLKKELDERTRIARERRRKEMERRAAIQKSNKSSMQRKGFKGNGGVKQSLGLNINNLWSRVLGEVSNEKAPSNQYKKAASGKNR